MLSRLLFDIVVLRMTSDNSLLERRFTLPDSYENALLFLKKLEGELGLEYSRSQVLDVKFDIRRGSYIREAEFLSDREIRFRYNEGSEEVFEVDSRGFVSAGEKKFDILPSVRHTQALELNSFYELRNKIFKAHDIRELSIVEYIDIVYRLFPKVRIDCPDLLYNIRDTHCIATRGEVFESYLKSALLELFSSLPDEPNLAIYLMDCTVKGCSLTMELLSIVNSDRENPLRFSSSDGTYTAGASDYYYHLFNPFNHLSSFKKDLVLDPERGHTHFDDLIEDQLDLLLGDGSLKDCSYIGLSYKPPAFVTTGHHPIQKGLQYIASYPELYDVGATVVTPHKPWVLLCISKRGDRRCALGTIHTRDSPQNHYMSVLSCLLSSMYVNICRNNALANEDSFNLMNTPQFDPYVDYYRKFYENSGIGCRFGATVRFKSKNVQTAPPTLGESVAMALAMSKLGDNDWYTADLMTKNGWTSDMLSRAVRLGMLYVGKDTSYYTYSKRSPGSSYVNFSKDSVVSKSQSISILLPSGEVISTVDMPDDVIAISPPVIVERVVNSYGGLSSNYIGAKNSSHSRDVPKKARPKDVELFPVRSSGKRPKIQRGSGVSSVLRKSDGGFNSETFRGKYKDSSGKKKAKTRKFESDHSSKWRKKEPAKLEDHG